MRSCYCLLRAVHGVGDGGYGVPCGKCSLLGIMLVDILANIISLNRFGRDSLLVFGLCSPVHRLLVREGIRMTIRRLRRARSRVIFVSDINVLYNIQLDSLLASAAY
jgi:hypothetical protein